MAISAGEKEEHEDVLIVIRFSDNGGHHGQLYFTNSGGREGNERGYEAPPLPPEGGFDVRFSTNRFLAGAGSSAGEDYSIKMQSVNYPLTVEWSVTDGMGGGGWELREGMTKVPMKSSGKMRLDREAQFVLHSNAASETSLHSSF